MNDDFTNEELKFLYFILTEAWFALDVRNMNTEQRKMYSVLKLKSFRLQTKTPA